eukprot:m.129929 g.129929  ORF g.129929 m.129929 type:complete len:1154 (+) comp14761_c3_seq2:3224-6685(+)
MRSRRDSARLSRDPIRSPPSMDTSAASRAGSVVVGGGATDPSPVRVPGERKSSLVWPDMGAGAGASGVFGHTAGLFDQAGLSIPGPLPSFHSSAPNARAPASLFEPSLPAGPPTSEPDEEYRGGTALYVTVESAMHIPDARGHYFAVSYRKDTSSVSTHAVDGADLTWEHRRCVPLSSPTAWGDITFTVWRAGTLLSGRLSGEVAVGSAVVDLGALEAGLGELCGWYHILDARGVRQGQLKVRIVPLTPITAGVRAPTAGTSSTSAPQSMHAAAVDPLLAPPPTFSHTSSHAQSAGRPGSAAGVALAPAALSESFLRRKLDENLQELDRLRLNLHSVLAQPMAGGPDTRHVRFDVPPTPLSSHHGVGHEGQRDERREETLEESFCLSPASVSPSNSPPRSRLSQPTVSFAASSSAWTAPPAPFDQPPWRTPAAAPPAMQGPAPVSAAAHAPIRAPPTASSAPFGSTLPAAPSHVSSDRSSEQRGPYVTDDEIHRRAQELLRARPVFRPDVFSLNDVAAVRSTFLTAEEMRTKMAAVAKGTRAADHPISFAEAQRVAGIFSSTAAPTSAPAPTPATTTSTTTATAAASAYPVLSRPAPPDYSSFVPPPPRTLDSHFAPAPAAAAVAQTAASEVGDTLADLVPRRPSKELPPGMTKLQQTAFRGSSIRLVLTNRSSLVPDPPRPRLKSAASSNDVTAATAQGGSQLWQERPAVVESGLLKVLPKNEIRRQECMSELVTTESAYLADVKILNGVFLLPLEVHARSCEFKNIAPVVKRETIKQLNATGKELEMLSATLMQELQARQAAALVVETMCDIMLNFVAAISSKFTSYCSIATEACADIDERSAEMAHFLATNCNQAITRGLPFNAFLLAPVQRLGRYHLLLNSILSATPEDHPDGAAVRHAHQAYKDAADACNERLRAVDNALQLRAIQESLDSSRRKEPINIVAEDRLLVKRGPVTSLTIVNRKVVKSKLIELMLFSDTLLYAKPMKLKKTGDTKYIVYNSLHRGLVVATDPADPPVRDDLLICIELTDPDNCTRSQLWCRCQSSNDKARWLDAFNPPKESSDIYDLWDRPRVRALYEYAARQQDELSLGVDDVIEVIQRDSEWSKGTLVGSGGKVFGWFPTAYVETIQGVREDVKRLKLRMQQGQGTDA